MKPFEVVKWIACGSIGGLVAMAAATLYIKRLDRQLVESIEATMDAVAEAEGGEKSTHGPEYPGRRTSFVVAIPRPDNAEDRDVENSEFN